MIAVEVALVTILGAALAAAPAYLLGGPAAFVVTAGAVGGLNGAASGARHIYDWTSGRGRVAFVLDSTWGLFGTALGIVVHVVNLASKAAVYRADHSRRRNRHVYEHGFKLKRGYVVTMGNVISNAAGHGGRIEDRPGRIRLIDEHEDLHVWQSRIFGVVMQATYVAWSVGGVVYGFAYWLRHRDQSLGTIVMTTSYYDNPFEYWAYRNEGRWPPAETHPGVRWPGRAG